MTRCLSHIQREVKHQATYNDLSSLWEVSAIMLKYSDGGTGTQGVKKGGVYPVMDREPWAGGM